MDGDLFYVGLDGFALAAADGLIGLGDQDGRLWAGMDEVKEGWDGDVSGGDEGSGWEHGVLVRRG